MAFRCMARFNASARWRTSFLQTFLKRAGQIGFITDIADIAKSWRPPLFCHPPPPSLSLIRSSKDVHVHHWGNVPFSNWDLVVALRSFNFQIYARWIYDYAPFNPILDSNFLSSDWDLLEMYPRNWSEQPVSRRSNFSFRFKISHFDHRCFNSFSKIHIINTIRYLYERIESYILIRGSGIRLLYLFWWNLNNDLNNRR